MIEFICSWWFVAALWPLWFSIIYNAGYENEAGPPPSEQAQNPRQSVPSVSRAEPPAS